jgi:oligopeptidase B
MKKTSYFLLGCVIFAPVYSQIKTNKMSDKIQPPVAVSYTHLRAHETEL